MIQGLSAGGECTTAFTYMIENSKPHRRGLIGGIACASMTLGTLLGSGVGALVAGLLTVDQLHGWGWRIPFLSGLAVGVVGWFMRRRLADSYRAAFGVIGGLTPLAATWLVHRTGTDLSPGFLMMAAAAISLAAAFFFRETVPAKAKAG